MNKNKILDIMLFVFVGIIWVLTIFGVIYIK